MSALFVIRTMVIESSRMIGTGHVTSTGQKCTKNFGEETSRKDTTWKACEHTRLLLKRMFNKQDMNGVGWTHLAHDKSKQRTLTCFLRLKTYNGLNEDRPRGGLF
jgi:hypothetical protein